MPKACRRGRSSGGRDSEGRVTDWTQPAHGKVRCNEKGERTYTPDPGFTGADAFTYTASDGSGGTRTASVSGGCESPSLRTTKGTRMGTNRPGDRGERPASDGKGPTNSGGRGSSAVDGGDSATEPAIGNAPGARSRRRRSLTRPTTASLLLTPASP